MSQIKPWELLESTVALDEKWFPVRKDRVCLPRGTIVDDYFVMEETEILSVSPVELWELIQNNEFPVVSSLAAGLLALKALDL